MKTTKIMVKRDGRVVNVSKRPHSKIYEIKTVINPYLHITYTGFETPPQIGRTVVSTGDVVRKGQFIRG